MTRSPHSLFATDKRARDAERRSVSAIWLALLAWAMAGVALAGQVVAWLS